MGKRGFILFLGVLIFLSLAASAAFAQGGATSGAVRSALHRILRQMTREELVQVERHELQNGWKSYMDRQLLRYLGYRVEQGETRALTEETMGEIKEALSSPEALDRYVRRQGLLEALEEGPSQVIYEEVLGAIARLARGQTRKATVQAGWVGSTQTEIWGRIEQAVVRQEASLAALPRFMDPLFQQEVAAFEFITAQSDRFIAFQNFFKQFSISPIAYHRHPEQVVSLIVREGGFRLSDETMALTETQFLHRLSSDLKSGFELLYHSKDIPGGVVTTIELSYQAESGLTIREVLVYMDNHLSSRRLMAGPNVIHEELFGALVNPY